jgi:hypothetical protein
MRYSTSRPADLHVGMSPHAISLVTFSLYGSGFESKTHRGRRFPARHWATASMGLFTVESTCLPTSCVATSPPPLNGT